MEDITDVASLDSFLENATQEDSTTEDAAPAAEDTTNPEQQAPAGEQEPAEQDKGYYTAEEKEQIKANKAYASMRVENTTLKNALAQFAKQNGYSGNPSDLRSLATFMQQLQLPQQQQQQPLEAQTQQQQPPQQISPELAQYNQVITTLRQRNQQLETDQITFLARQGFSQLQQEYGLTADDMNTVAEQFAERGLDPYSDPTINIVDQFKLINYDKIVERAAQEKANEILAREREALKHSTAPGNTVGSVGGNSPASGEIKTVADLERFFNEHEKGR